MYFNENQATHENMLFHILLLLFCVICDTTHASTMCHASSVCIVIVMSFVGPDLQNHVTPSEEG